MSETPDIVGAAQALLDVWNEPPPSGFSDFIVRLAPYVHALDAALTRADSPSPELRAAPSAEEAWKRWNPALFGITDTRTKRGFIAGYNAALALFSKPTVAEK